eukprot:CAMPEP_0197437438 /NCGR_PEP_ID=MMETSP1175-20131217/4689_1 /TAXON_ID=1003142 /ORGANISM="Triceratium dubium, Strain CCMP147" /LENGTH=70 /DNA_ID=CAMNT_0042966959 /DNA_START=15 /DNA_END=224 /DNA_ORIENTATION=-
MTQGGSQLAASNRQVPTVDRGGASTAQTPPSRSEVTAAEPSTVNAVAAQQVARSPSQPSASRSMQQQRQL